MPLKGQNIAIGSVKIFLPPSLDSRQLENKCDTKSKVLCATVAKQKVAARSDLTPCGTGKHTHLPPFLRYFLLQK